MRNPRDPGWPERGERTELVDVADRWKWAYVDWIDDMHRARMFGRPAPRKLGQAILDYLAHRETRVSRQTYVNDRAALRHLADDFGPETPVEAVDPQRTLDRMLRSPKWKASTVRATSRFLSGFWTWLELPYKAKLPKTQARRAHCWTEEQVREIRKAAGDLLLPLDLGLYMGLRLGEIWALRWEDIGRDVVRVQRQYPDRPLKSKRERTAVVLPGWKHRRGKGPVITRSFEDHKLLADVLRGVGVKADGVLWHAARHTYARRFLEAEPNMRLLQASLGHASVTTTETLYNWLLTDDAAEMARARIHRHKRTEKRHH